KTKTRGAPSVGQPEGRFKAAIACYSRVWSGLRASFSLHAVNRGSLTSRSYTPRWLQKQATAFHAVKSYLILELHNSVKVRREACNGIFARSSGECATSAGKQPNGVQSRVNEGIMSYDIEQAACPLCGKLIAAEAIDCPHCGSYLGEGGRMIG